MSLLRAKETERPNVTPVSPLILPALPAPVLLTPSTANDSPAMSTFAETPSDGSLVHLVAGSKIKGNLFFKTSALIDGEVEGEIKSEGVLTIGESAVVVAPIEARSVVVSGEVKGDIMATERIELGASARVLGKITSPTLVIRAGAWFEGRSATQPEESDIPEAKTGSETRPAMGPTVVRIRKRWFGFSSKRA
jgi:cytoskeletal protein CcmA (bactofilin family)